MPIINGPTREPSFEDFVESDKRQDIGKKIVDHLDEAEARVKAGIDPIPPYEEGTDPNGNIRTVMEGRNPLAASEVVDDDKKDNKKEK